MNTAPSAVHHEWIAAMQPETRDALVAAQNAGVAVDEFGGPVFYEVEVDLLRCSTNMGTIVGTVIDAIGSELDRYRVESARQSVIFDEIRRSAYETPGGFYACLGQVMRWVSTETE